MISVTLLMLIVLIKYIDYHVGTIFFRVYMIEGMSTIIHCGELTQGLKLEENHKMYSRNDSCSI